MSRPTRSPSPSTSRTTARRTDAPERYPALTRDGPRLPRRRARARHVLRRRRDRRARAPISCARSPTRGHEVGFHGWHHVPLTELDPDAARADAKRGKACSKSSRGTPVLGFRAPHVLAGPRVALGGRRARRGRASPTRRACCRRATRCSAIRRCPPRRSAGRTGWSSCRARSRASAASASPTSAASTCARSPTPAATAARRTVRQRAALWIYCHPYDFDPDEPFWVVPEVGRLGSRLLWYNRRRTFAKVEALLARRRGAPLGERIAVLESAGLPTSTAR